LQDIQVEQCISDKYLILNQPISAAYNQLPDATYLYGSTQRGKRQIHHGIDIKNNLDTPVLAAEDGVVIVAGKDDERAYGPTTDFYGQLVIIRHDLENIPKPVYTLYGHLYHLTVKVGQKVKRGQMIGTVGMGGVAIGYHLHFEVRYGKNDYESTRNPVLWLMPTNLQNDEKNGVLSVRIISSQGKPIQVPQIVLKKKEAAAGELPLYINAYEIHYKFKWRDRTVRP
jgi:murein DD-endopeptidase MepM/ murein hydrolase activator NlpD